MLDINTLSLDRREDYFSEKQLAIENKKTTTSLLPV